MNDWPPALVELADRALRENGGAVVGNHLDASDSVTVNLSLDIAVFDALPPAIRYVLNYCSDRFSAADLVTIACRSGLSPAAMIERIDGRIPLSPGIPRAAAYLAGQW